MKNEEMGGLRTMAPRLAACAALLVVVFLFARPVAVSGQERAAVRTTASVVDGAGLAEAVRITGDMRLLLGENAQGDILPAPVVKGSLVVWVSERDARHTVTVVHLGH